jgi:hypothetical protein
MFVNHLSGGGNMPICVNFSLSLTTGERGANKEVSLGCGGRDREIDDPRVEGVFPVTRTCRKAGR